MFVKSIKLFNSFYLCFSSFSSGLLNVLSFPCLETTLFLLDCAWITPKIPDFLANGFHLAHKLKKIGCILFSTFQFNLYVNLGIFVLTYLVLKRKRRLMVFQRKLDCRLRSLLAPQKKPAIPMIILMSLDRCIQ